MYYKALDNSLHCIEPEFDYLLPEGAIAISDEEYQSLLPPPPAPTPLSVSPRQMRQALSQANLRAEVETAVAAGNQDLKDWWEYATSFVENHPQVVTMAQQLNISDAELHDLFVLASSL